MDDVVVAVLAERTVRFSKVPSCVGSSPAIDTELWLRKTSYTCALSKIASSRACKTELTQHVVVLGLDHTAQSGELIPPSVG